MPALCHYQIQPLAGANECSSGGSGRIRSSGLPWSQSGRRAPSRTLNYATTDRSAPRGWSAQSQTAGYIDSRSAACIGVSSVPHTAARACRKLSAELHLIRSEVSLRSLRWKRAMSGGSLLNRCDIIHNLAGITAVTRTRQAARHGAAFLPALSFASRRHHGRPGGCIPSVATWSLATTPKSLPAGTVQRVLEQQNRTTPLGRRNYAILLLLARLGLRAGEVVRLNLEDIDWENGVIRIRRKGGRWTPLPLLNDVGEALATYLHFGRPQSCCRRVFLRHRAPVSGFAHTITVSSIVRRLLIRTGVDSARTGAHLLRHSLAVDLLRKGASLDEIGDVLGHRSQNTTAIYAKVDLAALRPLALAWPGGAQ